jgi:hypothetical protein
LQLKQGWQRKELRAAAAAGGGHREREEKGQRLSCANWKRLSCANWKSELLGVKKIPFLWPVMSEEAWTNFNFE